jgi:hypothetical protein
MPHLRKDISKALSRELLLGGRELFHRTPCYTFVEMQGVIAEGIRRTVLNFILLNDRSKNFL